MSAPAAIPTDLHTGFRQPLTEALGAFWSSVFADTAFVDDVLTARILAACQLQLSVQEALALRDHRSSPAFSRRHWQPLLVRLSQRNTGRGLTVGMDGTPVVGAQPASGIFLAGEVFEVGGNAAYSKVYTYPLIPSANAGTLVAVATALCDSVSNPQHVLAADRDFTVEDGVLVIRKECDPFESGGYRIVADGDDRLAVLWACDAAVDTNNVSDFIGYPLGVDTPSTEAAAQILSALWDVVTFGISPGRLNAVLGAVFDVPYVPADTTIESVTTSGGVSTVVTADSVYQIPETRLSAEVTAGVALPAGTLLTNDLSVYHSLSPDELRALVTAGTIGRLTLLLGSVLGVTTPVVLENLPNNPIQLGGWFKLNAGDTADSPFWTAVFARTTATERATLLAALAEGGSHINPLLALGYPALANAVLVTTNRGLRGDPCAGLALTALHKLIPASSSLVILQTVSVDDTYDLGSLDDMATGVRVGTVAGGTVTEGGTLASGITVTVSGGTVSAGTDLTEAVPTAGDDVSVAFLPLAATEV